MNIKWLLRTKIKIIFFYKNENIQFIFLGTKIKIRYIYRDVNNEYTLFGNDVWPIMPTSLTAEWMQFLSINQT